MDFILQEENCLFVPFQSSAHLSTSHHRSSLCHWSFFLGANSSSWVSRPELPVSTKECLGVLQEGWPGFKEQERWPRLSRKRHFPGCAVVNKQLIVAGGQPQLNSTEIIDFERRTILSIPNMESHYNGVCHCALVETVVISVVIPNPNKDLRPR